jgi:hypothetical protein
VNAAHGPRPNQRETLVNTNTNTNTNTFRRLVATDFGYYRVVTKVTPHPALSPR